jgi:hypothetical protein
MTGMHDEGRHLDLRQERTHVHFAIRQKSACGVGGRGRDSLKLVEPVGLFLIGVRNKLGCEHLPECRIFLTPSEAHEGEHRFPGCLLRLGPRALLPADGKTSE